MLQSILENIAVTIIVTALSALAKRIFKLLTAPHNTVVHTPKAQQPHRVLKKQFYASLFTFAGCLIVGLSIQATRPFSLEGGIKVFALLIAGFSFLFVMGAFDAAMAFYPCDDMRDNSPSEKDADSSRK